MDFDDSSHDVASHGDAMDHGSEKMRLEIDLLRQELKLKEKEFDLKEKELQDLEKKRTWRVDPVMVGIAAALIGFLGNVVATSLQGRSSLELEREKHEATRSLEIDKFRSSLVLEAIKTGDPEKAARNIEFFLAAGFIDDPSGKISRYLSETKNIPVLPSSGLGPEAGEPVERLPSGDAIRQIASAVGLLVVDDQGFCTAWIVSKDYLMTADYCVSALGTPVKRLTLRMGFISTHQAPVDYSVDPTPIEIDRKLGYAILRVQGNPAEKFGIIPLATREPVIGEPLFVLHHSSARPLALTRGSSCRVTEAKTDLGISFGHTCDTLGGSGGAPVIAATDFRVLGLHHSGDPDGKWNVARRFSLILQQSKVLHSLVAEARHGSSAVGQR